MSNSGTSGRRKFIKTTAGGTVAFTLGLTGLNSLLSSFAEPGQDDIHVKFNTGFDQQPLPYAYDALENVIDAKTMEIHYSKHAAAYAKNLKEAAIAEKLDINQPVEKIFAKVDGYSAKIRNNAGGHYNHEMFWKCMRPKIENNKPVGSLKDAIEKELGGFDKFKGLFSDAAKNRFGSGWAWLYLDAGKQLKIGSTPNQDNPLMNISEIKGFPLLGIDVWEHAYYLKYQNKRADYIENWWNVVNWDYVQQRYENKG